MNPIQTNKPVFFGNNGEVLKNGYIYIGQPNQDPVPTANRKTVTFQDTSGTQFTAQQPLRTGVDGRIVYQATGKPIIALVDGNYSMLIQDENQVIIKNGYTPFVANATTTAGSSTVIYRSTLVDLKAYNGTPGDYVENVGKVTATDGEGARWLVISNTGSPGDDVDLIDFDNGTQGVRVENQLYTNKRLGEIAAAGAVAQEEARGNVLRYDSCHAAFNADATRQSSVPGDNGIELTCSLNTLTYTVTLSSTVTIASVSMAYIGGPPHADGFRLSPPAAIPGTVTNTFDFIILDGGTPVNDSDFIVSVTYLR